MDKLYFDNNANENAEIDLHQMQLNISDNFNKLADKLKPMYAELTKEISNSLEHTLNELFQKTFESMKNAFIISPEVVKGFQKRIESYCKEFQFLKNNQEITVELNDKDIKVINNFNININNYANTDKSNKNKKIFTYDRFMTFLNLLVAILSLVHTDNNQQPCLCAETQQAVVQLQEQVDDTNNLISKFVKQLNDSTADEITSADSEVSNEKDCSDSE